MHDTWTFTDRTISNEPCCEHCDLPTMPEFAEAQAICDQVNAVLSGHSLLAVNLALAEIMCRLLAHDPEEIRFDGLEQWQERVVDLLPDVAAAFEAQPPVA